MLQTLPPQKLIKPTLEPSVPVPMLGESQIEFFDRAMRALKKSVPSINRRTVEILKIWCASVNDQHLRDKAFLQFPEDRFTHFGPRCVFLDHTVPANADGSRDEIVYDRPALQKLVDWANYRIENSEQFAAISDGHTPTAAEKAAGIPMPEVLGYAGPFYLGLLGDVDPKWAIYADEWVHNEDIQRFEKLQRRSPEVWVNEPIESRTMDPIAALGAETPRLDSGMNPYCRRANDERDIYRELAQADDIVRYSASSVVEPDRYANPTGINQYTERAKNSTVIAEGHSERAEAAKPSDENYKKLHAIAAKAHQEASDAHSLAQKNGGNLHPDLPGHHITKSWSHDVIGAAHARSAGIPYEDSHERAKKTKYSAAAFPGPSNSFIPVSEKGRKTKPKKYGASAMPNPSMGQDQGKPDIGSAIAQVIDALMPSIVQGVEDIMSGGSTDIEDEEPTTQQQPGELAPVPEDPEGATNPATVPRGDAQPPEEEDASMTTGPGAPQQTAPGDDEEKRYKAQGPAIYAAFCAGKRSSMQYSRGRNAPVDDSMHKRMAALEAKNRKLEKDIADEKQDSMRYSRLVDLASQYDFDPKDELETVVEMTEPQFERHCTKTISRYQKRDDVTTMGALYDDPNFDPDRYGRAANPNEPTEDELVRYSREASQRAVDINAVKGPGTTNYWEQYEALMAEIVAGKTSAV